MREFATSPASRPGTVTGRSGLPGRTGVAKLPVSHPGDPLEREADHVADLVMGAPERDPDAPPTSSRPPGPSPSAGGGRPLPDDVRSSFGSRFGHDFSRVRVHTDAHAPQVAALHQARALTVGHDITFARCEYAPTTSAGRHLLAHELAHVLQQSDGSQLQRQALEGDEPGRSELRVEDGVEIDRVFGASGPVGGVPHLHGPAVVQRVCARPAADVGYPVRVDLGIPATPPPDRSRTTAQISAMAGDASGRTAGLTRYGATSAVPGR